MTRLSASHYALRRHTCRTHGGETKGRKQHIAVDTLGFILALVVHSAGIQNRTGARAVLIRLFGTITSLKRIYVDGGYAGKLIVWAQGKFGWFMEVVKRNETGKLVVLPKRWIVERRKSKNMFNYLSQVTA